MQQPLGFVKRSTQLSVGADNFTWDTDYPHPDGTYPWGIEAMLKQPISDEARRKIFWDNAARTFNLS